MERTEISTSCQIPRRPETSYLPKSRDLPSGCMQISSSAGEIHRAKRIGIKPVLGFQDTRHQSNLARLLPPSSRDYTAVSTLPDHLIACVGNKRTLDG